MRTSSPLERGAAQRGLVAVGGEEAVAQGLLGRDARRRPRVEAPAAAAGAGGDGGRCRTCAKRPL